jgi:hypothetical protein
MVDVFSSATDGHKTGDYSSTSALRQWGKPATFNHLRLAAPRTFSVTPCDAEVVNWENLVKAGSFAAAKEKAQLKLEGKEYIVQDGDVILFRHSS